MTYSTFQNEAVDEALSLEELNDISLFIDAAESNKLDLEDSSSISYKVDQSMTDEWGLIGYQERINGLRYGDPRGNKKVSDEIFSAFEDGTIELVGFPRRLIQEGGGNYIDYSCDTLPSFPKDYCGIKTLSQA